MFLVLFLLLPVLELYVFVQVAGSVGFGSAVLGAVVATTVGIWVVKQQGLGVLRRANDKVARGEAPADEVVNGMLLLVAGILLLLPGFVTGAAGLLLLLPPVRALLRSSVGTRIASGSIVIDRSSGLGRFGRAQGSVLDAESWEDPPRGPHRPELP